MAHLLSVLAFVLLALPATAQAPDIGDFPYSYVVVPGHNAVLEREALAKTTGDQVVIVGSRDDFEALAYPFRDLEGTRQAFGSPEDILARARQQPHPEALLAIRDQEREEMRAFFEGQNMPYTPSDPMTMDPGPWPRSVGGLAMFLPTVHANFSGGYHDEVYLVRIPATASWEIPAYLYWGGWNANPPPSVHVATLRDWHARYGADLVGITNDVLNVSVTERPATREEALALAREQFLYCEDIVFQGVGDISPLAAGLMASTVWYFWWD